MMITSSSNPQLKNLIQLNKKAKARKEQQKYIVEGYRMYVEAPLDQIEKVYVAEHFAKEHPEVLERSHPLEVVDDRVFAAVSDTKTPQGILCVMRQTKGDMEKVLEKEAPFFIILEDLQDPGNMGTIFRTAEGAGVDGIFLSRNCVDIYNPKTIRSTMGSIYRVPFQIVDHLEETVDMLKKHKVQTYAAHLHGKLEYDQENYISGCAFLIGNEGNGLSDHLSAKADHLVRIPMEGKVESLNAAMAAGILMYEAGRQRRRHIRNQ